MLQSFYDYFGAHTAPERYEHEIDRARQRLLFPFVLLPAGIYVGHIVGSTAKGYFGLYSLIPMFYGVLSLVYLAYLRRNPTKGALPQYLFILCDPIMTVAAIAYEPGAFAWLAVFLLVVVTRTGLRYGMRTLILSWCSAAIGAVALLGITVNEAVWISSKDTYMVLASTLLLGIPLFLPAIKIQNKAHEMWRRSVKVEAMAENLAARSEFLSKVSHELRSPLQSILSVMDLIELRGDKPLEPSLIRRMRRAASGLSRQMNDLLTLARGEAGSLTISPEVTDWATCFDEIVAGAKEIATSKGLRLVFVPPENSTRVVMDGLRVTQIAENLISNALKYTEDGTITVRMSSFDEILGEVRFAVEDTGVGIDKADVKDIFTTYERAGSTRYAKESSGVGLAVVQTLLTYLGGSITVQSELAKGSTFSVSIPALQAAEDDCDQSGQRVLVVDDREDVLTGLAAVISELGFVTDVAASVGVASNLLAVHKYDIVLFDLQMPLKSGAELASDIRRTAGPNQHGQFIAMTASDDESAGRRWPFNAFARKPLSAGKLKSLLRARNQIQAQTSEQRS
ncbi:hybrid sensor histidine kinase/response regulator [Ottowia sp.]|uniref:hybrid sensor histidine kinase/response regulator n=1 Tax=Ottowia sp. TaxID=1898956 RepID=UPI0025CFEF6A|nr:hybrid sensor histidine kinase/response regulator [Ottowia sp.]MBK6616068.1 response regulator [Ottowia sp.]